VTGDWSAVIVNYNGDPFLAACLAALERVRLRPRDVFVVDNASTDDSMRELVAFPLAQALPQSENRGFAEGANAGLERVETTVAVVLNPDVEIDSQFGDAVVEAFTANQRLGVAGSLLLYPDGQTVQHAGGILHSSTLMTDHRGRGQPLGAEWEREVDIDYGAGAAMGLRMEALRDIGGFDGYFSPVYYEDVDLCERMRRAGWEVRLIPTMRAIHHEGVTLGVGPSYYHYIHQNRIRFALRYLSPEAWATEFVPHEFQRIRHELAQISQVPLASRTGAGGIEMLLRGVPAMTPVEDALPLFPDFPDEKIQIDELQRLRSVEGGRIRSRIPLLGMLRNLINDLGPRQYVDAALGEQRAFNDALVRAFETQQAHNSHQQQLNREQTAALLLLALSMLGRLRQRERSPGSE
jgi:GT2 family glycosyltransferase